MEQTACRRVEAPSTLLSFWFQSVSAGSVDLGAGTLPADAACAASCDVSRVASKGGSLNEADCHVILAENEPAGPTCGDAPTGPPLGDAPTGPTLDNASGLTVGTAPSDSFVGFSIGLGKAWGWKFAWLGPQSGVGAGAMACACGPEEAAGPTPADSGEVGHPGTDPIPVLWNGCG
eukprot:2557591-Rhodomonas_salina.1